MFDNSKNITISLTAANGVLRQDFTQIQNNLVKLKATHVSEISLSVCLLVIKKSGDLMPCHNVLFIVVFVGPRQVFANGPNE